MLRCARPPRTVLCAGPLKPATAGSLVPVQLMPGHFGAVRVVAVNSKLAELSTKREYETPPRRILVPKKLPLQLALPLAAQRESDPPFRDVALTKPK